MIRYAIPKREPLLIEHERFRDAFRAGGDGHVVTLRQGLRTVEVSAAVLESAKLGRTVSLPAQVAQEQEQEPQEPQEVAGAV